MNEDLDYQCYEDNVIIVKHFIQLNWGNFFFSKSFFEQVNHYTAKHLTVIPSSQCYFCLKHL